MYFRGWQRRVYILVTSFGWLFLLFPSSAVAKCISVDVMLAGKIETNSNSEHEFGLVFSWLDGLQITQTAASKSEESGQFNTSISYSTYSGRSFFGHDQCNFKLSSVDFEVYRQSVLIQSGVLALDQKRWFYTILID